MLKKLDIIPPRKGYVEATAFGEQPPDTSPDALNVVPLDPSAEQFRIASRSGDGKFDFFDFNNNQTISGLTTGDPIINVPARDCWTVSTTLPGTDVHVVGGTSDEDGAPGTCGPGTIVITPPPGDDPSGGPGTIDIDTSQPGSGPPSIPAGGGGGGDGGDGDPPTDPDRPWLSVRICGTGTGGVNDGSATGAGFWVNQSVLAVYNALPILLDNSATGDTAGMCLFVTGQRTDTPNHTRDASEFTFFPTCTSCGNPDTTFGYLKYTIPYDCEAGTWGTETGPVKRCITHEAAGNDNSWVFDGDSSTNLRTYNYYMYKELACDDEGDVPASPTQDQADEKFAKLTTLINTTPDTCTPGTTITVRRYGSDDVLQETFVLTKVQNWNYTNLAGRGLSYRGSPVNGWQITDYELQVPLLFAWDKPSSQNLEIEFGRYDEDPDQPTASGGSYCVVTAT